MGLNRRNFIEATGAAALTGLAGCAGDDSNPPNQEQTDTQTPTETTSEQNEPAQIEFLESHGIQILPILNEENIDNQAGISLEVEDQNGLEHVQVAYNDEHRDEPLTLYDKARREFEQRVDGEKVPISQEFPQRLLAPNTGEFQVEATDVNGNTETRNQSINNLNGNYRADRKRTETGNIGNYNTERNWDNLNTNTEEIQEMQQDWLNQEMYTPLVNQVMSGENFEAGGRSFPNSNYEENDPGYFDQDAVQNEDDFETLIRWYLPAIIDHDDKNYGNAPSSRNHRFATTLETLLNEHHPNAEATSTFVTSLPAHGIFGVQNTKEEKFYLVDTTSPAQYDEAVGRIGDFITSEDGDRSELWDPFHSFEPGPAEFGTYEGKSEISMGALMIFAATNEMGDNFDQFFITDEWMDEAYEALRNGGSIDPIVEPIEEVLYNAPELEENTKIGIYGSLDDTRIAVTSDEEIYETVMYDDTTTPGIDDIETLLETATAQ
jgi:hypothetical protein